jgi:hypothetical protein
MLKQHCAYKMEGNSSNVLQEVSKHEFHRFLQFGEFLKVKYYPARRVKGVSFKETGLGLVRV